MIFRKNFTYYSDIKIVCLFKLLYFNLPFETNAIPFPLLPFFYYSKDRLLAKYIYIKIYIEFFSSPGRAEESDEGS